MKNTRRKALLAALALSPIVVFADNVDVSGNIKTSGGHIFTESAGSYVKAQGYFYTPGYLQAGAHGSFGTSVSAGTSGSFGTTLSAGTSMQAPIGVFTNVLRTGGGSASGSYAAAIASGAANANYSVAMAGATTTAQRSAAIGSGATASSYSSLVIGQNNLLIGTTESPTDVPSTTLWQAVDPLFVVGNGADVNNRSNAFTIYKDGTITMSKAQGDVLMGEFGNPE